MSGISMILVILVAFLAGVEGILDEFEFHQPLVACTLIGIVTGQLGPCLVLGGSLQMMALGWANIGAAVSPDAALASVASAIILVVGGQGDAGVGTAIAVAIPLAVAGLFLTMVVRTISVAVVHQMDAAAEKGNFGAIEVWQYIAIALQGLRIAIPAACLCVIPAWPFFALGFVFAAIGDLTLIALGVIGVAMALIYLRLTENAGAAAGSAAGTGDPLGDILDDYE